MRQTLPALRTSKFASANLTNLQSNVIRRLRWFDLWTKKILAQRHLVNEKNGHCFCRDLRHLVDPTILHKSICGKDLIP